MCTTLFVIHVEGELLTEAEMARAFISPTVVNKRRTTTCRVLAHKCFSSVNMNFITCATVDYSLRCCWTIEQNNEVHSGIYKRNQGRSNETSASILYFLYSPFLTLFSFFLYPRLPVELTIDTIGFSFFFRKIC